MVCNKCGEKWDSSRKTCRSCGHDNTAPLVQEKREQWFTIFLYALIAVTAIFIIVNIISLLSPADGQSDHLQGFAIVKIILYAIEICFLVLLFKMKKKMLIAYFVFLILCAIVNLATFDIVPLLIKYVPVYFVFQSQWSDFK